ncbi:zinc finger protein ZFP2-like [Cylas formicarius]|uniref:zinc finger protein ZFP2-like n=1 Tax=Cylas formicarius TaxID=197179 RepID=UPI002958896C|nr:zinc finger protein ZFP2-like [Cylas formicarius]
MMALDFSKICRVCLGEGVMMSLFKVNVSKKLMSCASIQVWQNDRLPSQICNRCSAKLHIAFQFKKQCQKSDATLRQYLVNSEAQGNKVPEGQIATQNDDVNKLPNVQIGNLPAITQAPCIFIENANEAPSDMHFMHVPQNHAANQANFIISGQSGLQLSSYNVQGVGQIVYDNQYDASAVQQPAEVHAEMLPAEGPLSKLNDSSGQQKGGKTCPTCNKTFGTSTKLSRHVKTHSGDKPYKCTSCPKQFTHSGNFKIHMRMHTGERPFKCPVCDRGCRQAQDLEKHMRTHTGERPHKCPICPKAFSTSSNLIAHIRTHTGERPYVCCVCQKAFCQSNELTKHMRTHTGEKSHICDVCHRGFNGSSTLIVHKRSHTGERPYVCKVCDKGFTQSSCLAVHLRKHKNVMCCAHCKSHFTDESEFREHLVERHRLSDSDAYDVFRHVTDRSEHACNLCSQKFTKASEYKKHLSQHLNLQEA